MNAIRITSEDLKPCFFLIASFALLLHPSPIPLDVRAGVKNQFQIRCWRRRCSPLPPCSQQAAKTLPAQKFCLDNATPIRYHSRKLLAGMGPHLGYRMELKGLPDSGCSNSYESTTTIFPLSSDSFPGSIFSHFPGVTAATCPKAGRETFLDSAQGNSNFISV